MLATLLTSEGCCTISLPESINGKYWLNAEYEDVGTEEVGIEAKNGNWYIQSDRRVQLLGENDQKVSHCYLQPVSCYKILFVQSDQIAYLYTEKNTVDRQVYHKFLLSDECEKIITIGRSEHCHICIKNTMVSSAHAQLELKNDILTIRDTNSTNGTYVNQRRISSQLLEIGDVIYIMGVKIIVGNNMLAINCPDQSVKIQSSGFVPITKFSVPGDITFSEDMEKTNFTRSPNFKRKIQPFSLSIDPPPTKQVMEEQPLYLAIGSSMTMGIASLTTGCFTIVNAVANGNVASAIPTAVMSISMLTGSLLWPFLTRRYQKNLKTAREEKRLKLYRKYLDDIQYEVDKIAFEQQHLLNEAYISLQECYNRILKCDRRLWERAPGEDDFLKLRLGTGNTPLLGEIKMPVEKVTLSDDALLDEMRQAFSKPRMLQDVPVTLSFYQHSVTGITGNLSVCHQMLQSLIMQLVTFYGYDCLKLVYLSTEPMPEELGFLRELPHAWNDNRQMRYTATCDNEIKEISIALEREFEGRGTDKTLHHVPYYVVIVQNEKLSMSAGILRKILAAEQNMGFSVIFTATDLRALPKECSRVIHLSEDGNYIMEKENAQECILSFCMEQADKYYLYDISCALANIHLVTSSATGELPSHVEFLEMFGVKKAEHLNVTERWQKNDPTKTLEVPVGKNTYGNLFMLDLHEKIHGPHGLIAGMTGSGKSEFIITYILSLAINYHPYEVSFVLIDYKGGGMAKTFEKLPHVVGVITNLDGAAVKRSIVSIESELKRRQEMFLKLSSETGESNLDIYKYQKYYRNGVVKEPLSHLFIISDEFAELKAQRPEFMEQLISIARIGRSLGVHLILATQKPSGVVNDQIWSNSKFKVCLKVQTRDDSMSMLNRPEAAGLVQTGRFYLQIGYNELFEIGQSAWAGAPYTGDIDNDDSVKQQKLSVIDSIGRDIASLHIGKSLIHTEEGNRRKQVDVITEYICKTAQERQIRKRSLWCDPLPDEIMYDALAKKYTYQRKPYCLAPLLGEVDDPASQCQYQLTAPISEMGNIIVFGAVGSGKSLFLNTLLCSLLIDHTADELQVYIMDFDAETMVAFQNAPQVGDVVLIDQEEKINKLLLLLDKEMQERKKSYAATGGDYSSHLRKSIRKDPAILIVINNITAFEEEYEIKLTTLIRIARNGRKFGIYFAVSRIGSFGMRHKLLTCFSQKFILQSGDEAEYSSVLGKTEGMVPAENFGRGLYRSKEKVLEFQTATFAQNEKLQDYIVYLCKMLSERWQGAVAPPIAVLPEKITLDMLEPFVPKTVEMKIPIGYTVKAVKMFYVDLSERYIHPVVSSSDIHIFLAEHMSKLLSFNGQCDVMYFDPMKTAEKMPDGVLYASEQKEIEALNLALFNEVVERNNEYKTLLEEGKTPKTYRSLVVVIQSLQELQNQLTEDGWDKLCNVLLRGKKEYQISIIWSEKSSHLGMFAESDWYTTHLDDRNAIWVGDGINLQSRIKYKGMKSTKISDDFAFVIRKGKPELVKIPQETD